MALTVKRLEFRIAIAESGTLEADGASFELPERWTAEHLLLASLVRCSITSLRYHARRANLRAAAAGAATGLVTKREDDGRYAFVEIDASFDARIDPAPDDATTRALLDKAERDCFISATLRIAPAYHWRVNGRELDAAG